VDEDARVEEQPEPGHPRGEAGKPVQGRIHLAAERPPRREGEQAGSEEGHQEWGVRCVEAVVAAARGEGAHGGTNATRRADDRAFRTFEAYGTPICPQDTTLGMKAVLTEGHSAQARRPVKEQLRKNL